MAPALTEPLSPTESLNSSAVKSIITPTTRSSRKLESVSNKTGINNNISSAVTNNVLKSAQAIREKRNRGSCIANIQIPTSSKRITRSKDNQFRKSGNRSPSKTVCILETDNKSITNSINKNIPLKKNEQMGLSKALLSNKNNNSNSNILDKAADNTKDSSTAQLLADLTNEAITAEICLRNQLKDVDLVKTSVDPSSPIIQQDSYIETDIAVLKGLSAASEIKNRNTAHMEAQFNESSKSSIALNNTTNEEEVPRSAKSVELSSLEDDVKIEGKYLLEEETVRKVQHDDDQKEHKANLHSTTCEAVESDIFLHGSPVGSQKSTEDDVETKKKGLESAKLEILSVQELPPVSTDSTMTASEVEDNLEERLSQLDGTAIDSPPPNHDIESNEKNRQSILDAASPPHTPTHQSLSQDLQELQQQLQQTPPTPVNEQFQEHEQQQQISNCFSTSQSASATINTLSAQNNMTQSYIKDSDGGGAAELEDQDIEEVFKVLKGFEGGTASDLNVCDLNVLFNEVYMKINETELSGSVGSTVGVVASGTSTNTQNITTVTNPSIQLVKPTEMEEGQMEIEKRQLQMQRKIEFLMRRLRKLQARYMCKHTSEEIAGLFEWSARQASKGHSNTTALLSSVDTDTVVQDPTKCFLKVIAARPPASDWKDVHESLVPASQISTVLRKIDLVANAQQLCTTTNANLVNISNKKTKKALMDAHLAASSAASSPSLYNKGKAEEVVVATLEENVTEELSQVTGLLQSEMCEVHKAVDSDATESSSGGESADEMVTYNNTQQQTLPITKRAAWRYSRDRAAIASRWSWLLSQISDLEIKIRQHSELHQEIVRTKGLVTCGDSQLRNEYKLNINSLSEEYDSKDEEGSCRTRGYVPLLFRKRKLIQTTNIHTISKKAARPSTIKCGCQWPLNPCALCTGRLDPTAPRDLPDTMMMCDRIALLDSGYHPVLSFRENINNALHFEAIAKQPEWQQRVMRCQAKHIAKNMWRAEREAVAAAAGGHHSSLSKKYGEASTTKRRYIKKKDRPNTEDKNAGGKSANLSTGNQQQTNAAFISSSSTSVTNHCTNSSSITTASFNDVGNGTATLSTTTSTTPLVANKGMNKKPYSLVSVDGTIKEPVISPQQISMSNTSLAASLIATTPYKNNSNKFIHQTSDCLQTNFDLCKPNQAPSSLISNTSNHHINSKSNKNRKLSSSTTANSHHYSHHLNSNNSSTQYNGDSSYIHGNENWGVTSTSENFNIRSRTSSPIHGSSVNIYSKYERSLDRKNRSSYDIDNIVIPYSVAAATRVEILPYKEIPTPKWRVIENEGYEINKLQILSNTSLNNEAAELELKINNNVCESNRKMDPINSNQVNNEEKISKNFITKLESEVIELSLKNNIEGTALQNLKVSVKSESKDLLSTTNHNNLEHKEKIEHNVKEVSIENLEEPKSKKLKRETGMKVITINNRNEKELHKECKDDEITPQSCSKESFEEDEDISDDAMFLRHEKALTEERRKFQTYLKFPWSTRSRANRRIDSRAESSGANTPDPSSPAPQTPSICGVDQESIPSPVNPATPLNPLDTISEAGDNSTSFLGIGPLTSFSSKRNERRRTTSTKKDRDLERRSSTPDAKELVHPYDPLTFPLNDEQFDELLCAMPSEHSEDSKRFDECYLPVGASSVGLGGNLTAKYSRSTSGSNSKRTSRTSTLCGETSVGNRRVKSFSGNLRPISADDLVTSHVNGDMLLFDEYDDDYPKHHLAPNDDHLTADSIGDGNEEDDIYGDQYDAYVGRRRRKHRHSEGESSEEEPFQDDDPNDPEWRGEAEDRLRKKV